MLNIMKIFFGIIFCVLVVASCQKEDIPTDDTITNEVVDFKPDPNSVTLLENDPLLSESDEAFTAKRYQTITLKLGVTTGSERNKFNAQYEKQNGGFKRITVQKPPQYKYVQARMRTGGEYGNYCIVKFQNKFGYTTQAVYGVSPGKVRPYHMNWSYNYGR